MVTSQQKSWKRLRKFVAKIVASKNEFLYIQQEQIKSTLKKLENSGYIVGHAVVYGGQAKGSEKRKSQQNLSIIL